MNTSMSSRLPGKENIIEYLLKQDNVTNSSIKDALKGAYLLLIDNAISFDICKEVVSKYTGSFRQVEILNSFSFGYSNGFLEGINNKTKVMKRNAYGFRRFDHFRAKILLNLKYKDIGVHLG